MSASLPELKPDPLPKTPSEITTLISCSLALGGPVSSSKQTQSTILSPHLRPNPEMPHEMARGKHAQAQATPACFS